MIIDNEEQIDTIKKSKIIFVSVFIILLAVGWFEFLPIKWYISFAIVIILYLVFIQFWKKNKFTYLRYSDNGDFLEFKFYKLISSVGSPKYQMIKIPKRKFTKYETINNGKNESIVLIQKTKTGNFKYPPISLSAVSEKDKEKLKKNLLKYAGQNR